MSNRPEAHSKWRNPIAKPASAPAPEKLAASTTEEDSLNKN